LAALAIVITLASCKDAAGPEAFDPSALGLKTGQAFTAVENNDAVRSLSVLGAAFSYAAAPPWPVSPGPSAASPAALFPANVLGKTFEYSTQTGRYAAGSRPGAPANGVRFLLYEADPDGQQVMIPLEELGVLDLNDKSSASGNLLGVRALISNATMLDYDATASISGSSLSVSAVGYAANAGNRINFDLGLNASSFDGLTLDYSLEAPAQQLSITLVGSATSGSEVTGITLTVTEGDNDAEISASRSGETVSGTVKFNGHTVATISGTDTSPLFLGQSGRSLTAADLAGLSVLYALALRVFEGFESVLEPVMFVFGLNQ
jgi:hypothetical protein